MKDREIVEVVSSHLVPILDRLGLVLYDIEFHRGRRGGSLRIFIDGPGGVDVEACARVSDVLSRVLDVEDPIPMPFTLEVSSPGLTRKLTKPLHYRRSVGADVRVEMREERQGRRSFRGVLEAIVGDEGEEQVRFVVDGEPLEIPLQAIAAAQLVVEFGPPPARRHRRRGSARDGSEPG